MQINITNAERSTIHIALLAWKARCEAKEKQMSEWAVEYREDGKTDIADKCEANAKASRSFADEAATLLAKGIF